MSRKKVVDVVDAQRALAWKDSAEELSSELSRAVGILRGRRYRTPASVFVQTPDGPRQLGYFKHENVWGLYLEAEGKVCSVTNAALLERLAAAEAMPRLVEALEEADERLGDTLEDGIAALRSYLDELEHEDAEDVE